MGLPKRPSGEDPPHGEFFNARILRHIERESEEKAVVSKSSGGWAWRAWFMPAAAAAGMVIAFQLGARTQPAPQVVDIDVSNAPRAIPVEPILYTPEKGVKARWFNSAEADAFVIVLEGVPAIPDAVDFSKSLSLLDEDEADGRWWIWHGRKIRAREVVRDEIPDAARPRRVVAAVGRANRGRSRPRDDRQPARMCHLRHQRQPEGGPGEGQGGFPGTEGPLAQGAPSGFRQLPVLGTDFQPLMRSYESWAEPLKPSDEILIRFAALGKPTKTSAILDLEMWMGKRKIIKTDARLEEARPLILLGPEWRGGRLVILVRLYDKSATAPEKK
jgi:hypothetical protein